MTTDSPMSTFWSKLNCIYTDVALKPANIAVGKVENMKTAQASMSVVAQASRVRSSMMHPRVLLLLRDIRS